MREGKVNDRIRIGRKSLTEVHHALVLATAVFNQIEEITDPRLNRGLNHDFGEIMFIALTAMHRGIDDFSDSLRGRGIVIDCNTFAVRTTSGTASLRCGGKL